MNARNAIFAALCAAAAAAGAAPTGPYNSYLGAGVGDGSSMEFSNLVGADAAAGVSGVTRSGLYGVRAGYNSSDLYGVQALGFWAAANATYGSNVLAVGTSALRGTWFAKNSVFVGANAGRDIANGVSDSVFIGANAGRDANEPYQCLFIGENVGTNADQVSGRIEVYDLLYADRASGDFRIGSPGAGLSYSDGSLRIAGRTIAEIPTSVPFDFDLCLSPSGDDANDGRTLATAKRTIAAAVAAANANGGTNLVVAVMPGDYVPPAGDFGATNSILFRAVGEKSATRVVGGPNAVCALASAPCKWRGFTFTGFTGKGATDSTWPDYICRFGSMEFEDCDFFDNDVFIDYGYAAYNSCLFDGCTFDRNAFTVRDDALNKKEGILYRSCVLNNSFVDNVTIRSNNMFRILNANLAATNTFMRLPGSLHMCSGIVNGNVRYQYKNVTIVAPTAWPCERTATSSYICPFPTNEAVIANCFFVIEDATFNDDGTVDAGPYTTTGFPRRIEGAYVVANSTANLTADGVAADMDCPSVRDDGLPDYGYKSSGLGAAKTALAAEATARQEGDAANADAIAKKANADAISATNAAFSAEVRAAAKALVREKLAALDRATSSIGETIAALQSIYADDTATATETSTEE